jgi:L-alanine-DL-glutamate epimerase-like enolase superfamily enzyme
VRLGAGLGEASPLPGYSPDDLTTVRAALEGTGPDTPAAAFARFAAHLDGEGHRTGRPAHALLGARRDRLPLAALVADLDAAAEAVARGIHALKVKIGRGPLPLALLGELRARWPRIELRLDANGAPVEAAALAGFAPIYIEEGPAPFTALDESLQHRGDAEVDALCRAGAVRALVLKPMTLGPERCLALARVAAAHGVPVTVTHTFDGPVGLAAAAALALALPGHVLAVGLDRHAGLAAWPPARIAALAPAHIVAADAPGLGVEWI